jgi:hypothetical protein
MSCFNLKKLERHYAENFIFDFWLFAGSSGCRGGLGVFGLPQKNSWTIFKSQRKNILQPEMF